SHGRTVSGLRSGSARYSSAYGLNSAWYQSSGRSVWQIGISGRSTMPEEGICGVLERCFVFDAGVGLTLERIAHETDAGNRAATLSGALSPPMEQCARPASPILPASTAATLR